MKQFEVMDRTVLSPSLFMKLYFQSHNYIWDILLKTAASSQGAHIVSTKVGICSVSTKVGVQACDVFVSSA